MGFSPRKFACDFIPTRMQHGCSKIGTSAARASPAPASWLANENLLADRGFSPYQLNPQTEMNTGYDESSERRLQVTASQTKGDPQRNGSPFLPFLPGRNTVTLKSKWKNDICIF